MQSRDTQVTGLGEYGAWALLGRHRIGITDGSAEPA
jgi:hypothetical protein